MKKVALILSTILLSVVAFGASDEHKMPVTRDLKALKWGKGSPRLPAGVEMVVMAGNPAETGFTSIRAKFPPGYKIPPHFHPTDEHVTILSGSLWFGMGDKIDLKTAQQVNAGGYFVAPKDMHHYAMSKTGAVIQIDLMGPFQITYVNPSDDPEKKAAK